MSDKELRGIYEAGLDVRSSKDIAEIETLRQRVKDHEEADESHRALVRKLDVLLNGEAGAAKQASLCDIVSQFATLKQAQGYAGATIWVGDKKVTQIVTEASIRHEREIGFFITEAAQKCLDMLSAAPKPGEPA